MTAAANIERIVGSFVTSLGAAGEHQTTVNAIWPSAGLSAAGSVYRINAKIITADGSLSVHDIPLFFTRSQAAAYVADHPEETVAFQ